MPGLGLGSGSGLSGRLFSLFGLFALAFGVVLALAVAVTLAFDFAITFAFRGFFFLEVLGGGFLDVFVLAVVRVEAASMLEPRERFSISAVTCRAALITACAAKDFTDVPVRVAASFTMS